LAGASALLRQRGHIRQRFRTVSAPLRRYQPSLRFSRAFPSAQQGVAGEVRSKPPGVLQSNAPPLQSVLAWPPHRWSPECRADRCRCARADVPALRWAAG
jgi:hypothetical protein